MNIATIELDLAKNVLQLHAVDPQGHMVVQAVETHGCTPVFRNA
ncbi:L-lactate utilization protein LutB [Paraburkholderia sp. MM5496-R1]